jgi:HSP20 family protein
MLTLWRPHERLLDWSREFDRWLGWDSGNGNARGYTPAVDIEEEEDRFVIHADVPGLQEKDLEVRVHEGTLLLAGKREESKEEKTANGYYRERRRGSFCRQFRLGTSVEEAKIEASYKNGVLTVVLPKKEQAKPRQIPVHTS